MRRGVVVALAVAAASMPATVLAQGLTIQIMQLEGRDATRTADSGAANRITNNPIGLAECERNATLEFRVEGYPEDTPVLDFWQGSNCSDAANRAMDGSCVHLFSEDLDTPFGQDLRVGVGQFVMSCESNTRQTVAVLAANSPVDRGEVRASGEMIIQFDVQPPSAPSGVTAGRGNTQIPVNWDAQSDVRTFNVYVDAGGAAGDGGAGCASSELVAGAEPPNREPDDFDDGTATGLSLNGAELGLAVGQQAAVAVSAVDAAGNESPLSQVVCIERVETVGLCGDTVTCGDDGIHCAAAGTVPQQGRPWVPAAFLIVLMTGWLARRKS